MAPPSILAPYRIPLARRATMACWELSMVDHPIVIATISRCDRQTVLHEFDAIQVVARSKV
jgi:hypothetical protein